MLWGAIVFAVVSPVSANGVLILAQRPPAACVNNLSIDGTPQVSEGIAASQSVTLTTINANDEIVAFSWHNGGVESGSPPISDTAGLTWTLRANNGSNGKTWYAKAVAPLSSDVITFALTTSNVMALSAFAITGANTSSPWDPNGALPQTATSGNASITTTNSCTMPLAFIKGSASAPGAGAGWTGIIDSGFTLIERPTVAVTTPQSALSGTFTSGTSNGTIGDALTQ